MKGGAAERSGQLFPGKSTFINDVIQRGGGVILFVAQVIWLRAKEHDRVGQKTPNFVRHYCV